MAKQRWEESEKRREEKRRRKKIRAEKESEERKMQVRGKAAKSRFTVFFQWFVAPEGRKVGSLKRPVRSHLARWEMKKCTPMWHEAHVEVKTYKHTMLAALLEVECRKSASCCGANHISKPKVLNEKSAHRCGAKQVSKSKCTIHTMPGALLEIEMSKKCKSLWREAHIQVKMLKTPHAWTIFWRSDVVSRGRRKALCTVSKVSKTWGFCSSFKSVGRRISRGRRSTRDIWVRCVIERRFPERECILEHQILRFAEMILRDTRSTSYDLASQISWLAQCFTQMEWKKSQNAFVRGRQLCTQLSIFEGSLAGCFVFDVVNFEKWSLAE